MRKVILMLALDRGIVPTAAAICVGWAAVVGRSSHFRCASRSCFFFPSKAHVRGA